MLDAPPIDRIPFPAGDPIIATKSWTIGAGEVPFEAVVGIAVDRDRVVLDPSAPWRRRLDAARKRLDTALRSGVTIYGVTTGVGNRSARDVARARRAAHARSVVAQHGCGVGDPLSVPEARAVVVARLVTLCKGFSGVRIALLDALCRLLEADVVPVIPRWGSVGASGDLTPLSYVASVLGGDREAWRGGAVVPAAEALRACRIEPFSFAPKEELAVMNGTSAMTGIGILHASRLRSIVERAERATALAVEILRGRTHPFDARVHDVKPHPGQIRAAASIRRHLRGSRLVDPPETRRRPVQDRYSLRCSPQVLGSARDALDWVTQLLRIELNSANDNPLVDPRSGDVLMGGNFYGGHPALGMDLAKIVAANVADLVDRQFALLVDEAHNQGLPETLVAYDGCGLKGLQITCSALAALAVRNAAPDSTLSRSTECANQDKVSMGLHAGLHAGDGATHLARASACLLIALSNAATHRDEARVSPAGRRLLADIRRRSPLLIADRRLDADIESVARWLERPS